MSFISYAQNYEDVTLFRALKDVVRGVYIDVGAGDPVNDSVTRAFYERGWRGVNIEPVASAHARLVADRPEDTNLNAAAGATTGRVTLHEVVGTGMSTLVADIAEQHRAAGHAIRGVDVPVTTLDVVWDEQRLDTVHFLKIDVEGAERDVLEGIDLTVRRPWVILVEATLPNSMEKVHESWEALLTSRSYVFVHFDGLNRFYVASEKVDELRESLSLPPNYFDRFVRYADATIHQRAQALDLEVQALKEQLRNIASTIAADAQGSVAASGDRLAPIMQWLTRELDQREAQRAADRAQAAHDLHVREIAHAHRVEELSRMIDGLSRRTSELQTQVDAARDRLDAQERANAELQSARDVERSERARLQQALDNEQRELRNAWDVERSQRMRLEEALDKERRETESQSQRLDQALTDLLVSREALARSRDELSTIHQATIAAEERRKEESDRLAADLKQAREARDLQRTEAQHHREQATRAQQEIHAMHQSVSFRVTAPLRWIKFTTARSLNGALVIALGAVRAIPGGVRLAGRTLSRFPTLDRRLRRFSVAHPRRVGSGVKHDAPALEYLPPLPSDGGDSARSSLPDATARLLSPGRRTVYFYVDHTVQCPVNTGMQRVARGLARALVELGEIVRFVKWDRVQGRLVFVEPDELRLLAQWRGPVVAATELAHYGAAPGPRPVVPEHVLEEGHWLIVPEVTHINYHGMPLTLEVLMAAKRCNLRSAFIYYDAIPLRRPEMDEIAPLHETYMQQLLLADLVVPISEWSGSDIASFLVHHERANLSSGPIIAPLRLPGESTFSSRPNQIVGRRRRLILSVGTIERRKNQHTLVAAFEEFVGRHPDAGWELRLVGNVHPDVAGELRASQRRTPAITVTSNLPDDELACLYAECAFTVFPSIEEGFGLPILESLWHCTPCICADFGAMAEVAQGGGCLTVDARSAEALAQAIERLATNPTEWSRLAHEACSRKLPAWKDYAHAFSQLLDRTADPLRKLGTIFYCLEHTSTFAYNTGIQRVVRGLAGALIELGLRVVPCKWSNATGSLESASDEELAHFARWNGPPVSSWTRHSLPSKFDTADWLAVPELTVYPGGPDLGAVHAFSRRHAIRVATVFYDAVPWKMTSMYAAHWREQHARYMEAIGRFDRILAISRHSRDDLLGFLRALPTRTTDLEGRVVACPLPGEFLEVERSRATRQYDGGAVRILSVGSIEPRKNHAVLLQAFDDAVKHSAVPLELTLAGGFHMPEPEGSRLKELIETTPGVTWEENPDDARLRALYAKADFTVYPSLEEGFGLPILESLWNARPCICRDRSAMAEVALGGGCVTVDTADPHALAAEIVRVANDHAFRLALAEEAISRPVRTWTEYGRDVATNLANERYVECPQPLIVRKNDAFYREMVNLSRRPRLSICITTYNRGHWLATSLKNIARLRPNPHPDVEIVVCDNASTDHTPDVVKPYVNRSDFRYFRNPVNVGMLGNLRATAHHSRGDHVWILGDDDLVMPGAIERILQVLTDRPDLALAYLNYAYTREENASKVDDLGAFLASGTPIVAPGPDEYGPIRAITTKSENFFTAIYCLVFRRDHALRAYSQNTEGRPFSTMLTCIPTSYHVLRTMMNEPGCWIGEPQVLVNMNVSWLKYAPLWVLERLPELFDAAEVLGASPEGVDAWRAHNVPGIVHFFEKIYGSDPEGNVAYFSPARLVARFKHVESFAREVPSMKRVYAAARARGVEGTALTIDEVFAAFRTA
ncbi:MAG TPA: FkbM family methyltransferase [Casimicrobiaceae bacterium]|nr:FkbM family methyltransferase [Casimicrobiaceae bacterium]